MAVTVLGLMFGAAGRSEADILAQFTAGLEGPADQYVGQSVTTTPGGPFDNITFNFYSNVPATTPSANGDLFILTMEYLGAPSGLSNSTPGFLAESTGVTGDVYQFASSLTLQGATQYFFYTDQIVRVTLGVKPDGYTGGHGYVGASLATETFESTTGQDWNFLLSGSSTAVAVPEPSTAVVAAFGAVAFIAYGWYRHRREHRRQGAA